LCLADKKDSKFDNLATSAIGTASNEADDPLHFPS
jgi:hypothetical protein